MRIVTNGDSLVSAHQKKPYAAYLNKYPISGEINAESSFAMWKCCLLQKPTNPTMINDMGKWRLPAGSGDILFSLSCFFAGSRSMLCPSECVSGGSFCCAYCHESKRIAIGRKSVIPLHMHRWYRKDTPCVCYHRFLKMSGGKLMTRRAPHQSVKLQINTSLCWYEVIYQYS